MTVDHVSENIQLELGTQWRRANVAIQRDLAVAKPKGRSGPRTYEDNFSDCLLETPDKFRMKSPFQF